MENIEKKYVAEPSTFRVTAEDKQKFQEFAKQYKINQAEMFEALVQNYELAQAKTSIPERGKEIETFQDTLNRIAGMFINSLEINQTSESKIREALSLELTTKDKTIQDLQQYKENAEISIKALKDDAETLSLANVEIENKTAEISQQRDQINALTVLVAESQSFRTENKELAEANRTLISEHAGAMNIINNLKNEMASIWEQANFYKSEVAILRQENKEIRNENKEQLKEIKTEHQQEINDLITMNQKRGRQKSHPKQ